MILETDNVKLILNKSEDDKYYCGDAICNLKKGTDCDSCPLMYHGRDIEYIKNFAKKNGGKLIERD